MNKLVCIFVILLFYALPAQSQYSSSKWEKLKIREDIKIKLPADFVPMPTDVYARKYGAYRPPIAIYSAPDGYTDFGINETINRSLKAFASAEFSAKDLEMLKGMYKGSIAAMHSEVKWLKDEVREINGCNFIVLEFVGVVRDEGNTLGNGREKRQYSYLLYTVKEGSVLLFNFTSPARLQNQWQGIAEEIMENIKVEK